MRRVREDLGLLTHPERGCFVPGASSQAWGMPQGVPGVSLQHRSWRGHCCATWPLCSYRARDGGEFWEVLSFHTSSTSGACGVGHKPRLWPRTRISQGSCEGLWEVTGRQGAARRAQSSPWGRSFVGSKMQRSTCARPSRFTCSAARSTTRPSTWPRRRRRSSRAPPAASPPKPWTRRGGWKRRPRTR